MPCIQFRQSTARVDQDRDRKAKVSKPEHVDRLRLESASTAF